MNPAQGTLVDPAALMQITSMELRARTVVEGFLHGLHRSPYHGFSVEFTEYRDYVPGDDIRHIDWKLYARSDRVHIKRFEDETNLRCYLIVDQSRSMAFGSRGYTKAEYAATLAATLAQFLFMQGDAVGLMAFDERVEHYLPARNRPGHLRRLMLQLEQPPEGRGTDLEKPFKRIAEMLTKRSMVVLLSDLLAPVDFLEDHLSFLSAQGHDAVVFNLLDPAERDFDFKEPALFRDMESGSDLFVDPAEARKTYLAKLGAHQEKVRQACSRLGIDCHEFGTERPLELALFDFLSHRANRKRMVRRAAR